MRSSLCPNSVHAERGAAKGQPQVTGPQKPNSGTYNFVEISQFLCITLKVLSSEIDPAEIRLIR
jgi:hypothetical protein